MMPYINVDYTGRKFCMLNKVRVKTVDTHPNQRDLLSFEEITFGTVEKKNIRSPYTGHEVIRIDLAPV